MFGKTGWSLIYFLLIFVACSSGIKNAQPVVAVEVQDGDTCVVERDGKQWVVRLIGIDAWEIHANQRLIRQVLSWKKRGIGVTYEQGLQWGSNGYIFLKQLLPPGSEVLLVSYGKDQYGRILGSLYLSHRWINEEMVQSGWAVVYLLFSELPPEERKKLREAEKKAQRQKQGMWKSIDLP
ncbi:thermonuclease family protein [Thermospira aquatica]|uniref:Thermonuclease family protein n=1 Tax=Thermospira aquatica TaxID=2828656 RepID=A0AAX3BBK7_9SPIR|nr:thermonuclease family protein [Thermospira aquatica]URA09605.1 thermonuclease family protein [Thermospira aquatica]